MIVDILLILILVAFTLAFLAGAFYILQVVVERCLLITVPTIAQFIDVIRNPSKYEPR